MSSIRIYFLARSLAFPVALAACGAIYQAHTEIRTNRMLKGLQVGQSSLEVHRNWGEPDIRTYVDSHTQVWSYAARPNTNDVAAALLYTAPKEGDAGRFLDLKFVDGKLGSWAEASHTMPAKEGSGFSYGVGGAPMSNPAHY